MKYFIYVLYEGNTIIKKSWAVVESKYIYSSTVLKNKIKVSALYLSISMLCYFILLLHYIYLTVLATAFFSG